MPSTRSLNELIRLITFRWLLSDILYTASLIVGGFAGAHILFFFDLLPFAAVFLVVWFGAACWLIRKEKPFVGHGSDAAVTLLDEALSSKDRILSSVYSRRELPDSDERRAFISAQVEAILETSPRVPLPKIRVTRLMILAWLLCGASLGMFVYQTEAGGLSSTEAQALIEEVLKEHAQELPKEVQKNLEQVKDSIAEHELTSTEVQEALENASREIERAEKALEAKEQEAKTRVIETTPTPTPSPTATPKVDQKPDQKKDSDSKKEESKEQDKKEGEKEEKKDKSSQGGGSGESKDQSKQQDQKKDDKQGSGSGSGENKDKQEQNESKDKGSEGQQQGEGKDNDQKKGQQGDGKEQKESKALNAAQQAINAIKKDQQKPGQQGKEGKEDQKKGDSGEKDSKNKDGKEGSSGEQEKKDTTGQPKGDKGESEGQKQGKSDEKKKDQSKQDDNSKKKEGSSDSGSSGSSEGKTGQTQPKEGGQKESPFGSGTTLKETEIGEKDEKFDYRYADKNGEIAKNKNEAKTKTDLSAVTLAKPESIEDREKQPIPLEYKDLLK